MEVALCLADTVDTVDMAYTADMVYTVDIETSKRSVRPPCW